MDHRTLIGEILAGCIKRHRDARAPQPREPALAPITSLASPPPFQDGAARAPAEPFAEAGPPSPPPPVLAKGSNGTNGA